ncbi:ADP-ribosylation factor 1 [Babesia bigemina]|uniref:ADP-ribosylation factor 1 n=1 Tax=Babesia bigemina TaxID=5866 RepID=A0A061D6Q9_BABBI|nr:ADP-ribosylation factor 1 [Babesia bigemina]CDR96233.1 ADP-ribosylation factor 1 [Babesia bigemina]|eukprot:XP_012768419.1 ADP-ribosylation factor 1 [Babesia bigemina]
MVGILERIKNFRNRESIHIFLCGLRGSDWEGICSEIEPTTLYHYEELHIRGKRFSIWDFSGDAKVKCIPAYVARSVNVAAVIFVVSATEHADSSCRELLDRIRRMDMDDAFSSSLFVILLNKISSGSQYNGLETFLKRQLSDPHRFIFVVVNVLHGLKDAAWLQLLDAIYAHHKKTVASA